MCCYLPLGQGICFFFAVVCVINCYSPVIVSFLPLFLQIGLSISPRCYCNLLVNCTNHFFLKSVLCCCTKMSHGQRLYISVRLHKGRLVLLYPPHPTPSLIFSNYLLISN